MDTESNSPLLVTFGTLKHRGRFVAVAIESQAGHLLREVILAAGKRPEVIEAARRAREQHFSSGWSVFDEIDLENQITGRQVDECPTPQHRSKR